MAGVCTVRSRRIPFIATTLVLILLSGVAHGQSADVILPLTVNEVPRGEVTAVIAGDDVLMRINELEAAGMAGVEWQRLALLSRLRGLRGGDGSDLISLRSAAPFITFQFDEASLTLRLTVDARFLGGSAIDMLSNRPPNIEYSRSRTGFLNYSLTSQGFKDIGVFGEAGATFGGKLLYSSFSRDTGGTLRRGLTNLTVDQRAQLRRWTVGDGAVSTDQLGGSALVGGVTVSRNFQLDPYFIRYPALQVRGLALTPSQVDVYVNGVLVDRRQVAPGEYELRNLPVQAGTGVTRIVVRDAFGNERVETNSFYYSTAVLARGMNEYTYSAGLLRSTSGGIGDEYGDPAIVGFHRRGLTDTLTAGLRAEGSENVRSGGPSVALRTRLGDFATGFGISDADGGFRGTAAQFAYNYLTRRYSFGAAVRTMSREYANLSLRPENDRALLDATLSASMIVAKRTSLTLDWNTQDMRDTADSQRVALTSNVSVGRYLNLYLSVGASEVNRERNGEYLVGLSMSAGGNVSASLTAGRRGGRDDASVEIQRPLPVGTGYGFRIGTSLNPEGERSAPASAQYQTDFGRYEVIFDPLRSDDPTLAASGGLVFGGGSMKLTRAVQESYAIVRVPGVEGVRVYASNQLIGRTDGDGTLLVPNLLAYYGNQLRINDQDVPFEYEVAATERVIAPSYRGGAVVEFQVAQIRSLSGSIVISTGAGEEIPRFGQLTLSRDGKQAVSPLGGAGEFYLENLATGSWSGLVEWEKGTCQFSLTVPGSSQSFVELGRLLCTPEVKQ